MENFIGDVKILTNYDPDRSNGWLLCDGKTYDKNGKYRDLASIIGNQFGGDANNFAVPDLRGLLPIGVGPAVDNVENIRKAGDTGGKLSNTLLESHLLNHRHNIKVGEAATTGSIGGSCFGMSKDDSGNKRLFYSTAKVETQLPFNTFMMGSVGKTPPDSISNVQPVMGLYYVIATTGIYPTKP